MDETSKEILKYQNKYFYSFDIYTNTVLKMSPMVIAYRNMFLNSYNIGAWCKTYKALFNDKS